MPSGDELVHYFIELASIASPHNMFWVIWIEAITIFMFLRFAITI
jgi:hypothetical protein